MKRALLILFAAGFGSLVAQENPPAASSSMDPVTAFAVRPPDENSPFFLDAAMARRLASPEFRDQEFQKTLAEYPKSDGSSNTVAAQVGKFFTGMFSSVHIGSLHTSPSTTKLKIEPSNFSLKDRRELAVTYAVRNNTNKIMRLDYPNGQRIDVLTYDPQGKVIDRWSDDQSFDNQEGIVIINPDERIEYQEKIPTREMKAGQTYRIEALTTGEPNFTAQKFVTPQ